MLLLSMDDRDYSFIAHGDFANAAFTDYGKEQLAQEFLDDFRYDDWYGGFSDFISECDRYMALSAEGAPIDVEPEPEREPSLAGAVGVGAAASAAISGISCQGMKSKMKSVRQKREASTYMAADRSGIDMRASHDRFVNTTVTRVRIAQQRSGGGGGGGTTVNSGGFSGHSGKF